MKSYLTHRMQHVMFFCYKEAWGVPRGSCLGPLLFSILTSDLPLVFKMSSMTMFADDCTLFKPADCLNKLRDSLQSDFECASHWVAKSKLVLKVLKTRSTKSIFLYLFVSLWRASLWSRFTKLSFLVLPWMNSLPGSVILICQWPKWAEPCLK